MCRFNYESCSLNQIIGDKNKGKAKGSGDGEGKETLQKRLGKAEKDSARFKTTFW